MNNKDKILNFDRYGLTGQISLYNEDSMTAQQLAIKSASKIKECLETVEKLSEKINLMQAYLKIDYDENTEELVVGVQEKIDAIKEQVNNSFVCIFNEDSLTALELAGNTARATNECIKAVNMLADLVSEVYDIVSLNYDETTEMLIMGGENNAGN